MKHIPYNGGDLFIAPIEIDADRIKLLNLTPLKMIPAVTANTILLPQSIMLKYDRKSVNYPSNSGKLVLTYGSGSSIYLAESTILNDSADGIQQIQISFKETLDNIKGQHIYLRHTVADLTTGDGVLDGYIIYKKFELS